MSEIKSEERIKINAEVFTPPLLVNQMLSKLSEEMWSEGRTFCDPACGNGNFLVHVLYHKLCRGHDPFKALKSIFGVDIMEDSICQCRERLLGVIHLIHPELDITEEDYVKVVLTNIQWVPDGLDYDFSFIPNFSLREVAYLMARTEFIADAWT